MNERPKIGSLKLEPNGRLWATGSALVLIPLLAAFDRPWSLPLPDATA